MEPPEITFDLAYDVRAGNPVGRLVVQIDAPGIGAARHAFAVDLTAAAAALADRLGHRSSSYDDAGRDVSYLLLDDPNVLWVFDQAMAAGAAFLRFRLAGDEPVLHRIPWELVQRTPNIIENRRGQRPIVDGRTVVRTLLLAGVDVVPRQQEVSATAWAPGERATVLVVDANDTDHDRLLRPQRELIQAQAGEAFNIEPIFGRDATSAVLDKALTRSEPLVVHINGHGAADRGSIRLADGWIAIDRFAEMLSAHPSVRLVVLSCCHSGLAAHAVARAGIDSVVGVQHETATGKADDFVLAFYEELGIGGTPLTAMTKGRAKLVGDALEWALPVIYSRVRPEPGGAPGPSTPSAAATSSTRGGAEPLGHRSIDRPWAAVTDDDGIVRFVVAYSDGLVVELGDGTRGPDVPLADVTQVILSTEGAHVLAVRPRNVVVVEVGPGGGLGRQAFLRRRKTAGRHLLAAQVGTRMAILYLHTGKQAQRAEYELDPRARGELVGSLAAMPENPRLVAPLGAGLVTVGVDGTLAARGSVAKLLDRVPRDGWRQIDVAQGREATLFAGLRCSQQGVPGIILVRVTPGDDTGEVRFLPVAQHHADVELKVARSTSPTTIVLAASGEAQWWHWDQGEVGVDGR